jgi:hypothetical protein
MGHPSSGPRDPRSLVIRRSRPCRASRSTTAAGGGSRAGRPPARRTPRHRLRLRSSSPPSGTGRLLGTTACPRCELVRDASDQRRERRLIDVAPGEVLSSFQEVQLVAVSSVPVREDQLHQGHDRADAEHASTLEPRDRVSTRSCLHVWILSEITCAPQPADRPVSTAAFGATGVQAGGT